jgi:hypothetical protein
MRKIETAAFVCSHVFEDSKPILLVSREDGDWQLLCGHAHDDNERPHVVGLNHLLERDPTLIDIASLQPEWEAERTSPAMPWTFCEVSGSF